MTDISIVIPVYNCERYIRQCIESVQKQTHKNLEIICIDDGSSDTSLAILETLAALDPRIRIFRQRNLGAGAARNLGIEKAQGTYIAFLDADDYYIDPESLQCLLQRCIQLDIKACRGIMCHNINGKEKRASDQASFVEFSRQGVLQFSEYPLDYDFTTFIFERAVILGSQIRFPEYRFYEDPPFLVKTLFHVQEYAVADIDFYCYRIRQEQRKFTRRNCQALLAGLKENLEFTIQNNVEKLFIKTLSRLEYEYSGRICVSLPYDTVDGLKELIAINETVRTKQGYEDCIIRPLKKILEQLAFVQEHYEEELLDGIKSYESFYVFGTGMVARKFWDYLKRNGACGKVEGFLVTDKRNKENCLEDVPVYDLAEFRERLPQKHIYVAVNGFFVEEIVQAFQEHKIEDYEVLNTEILNAELLNTEMPNADETKGFKNS